MTSLPLPLPLLSSLHQKLSPSRYERNVFEQNSGAGFRIADPSRHTATDYFLLDSFAVDNKGSGFSLDTTAGALIRCAIPGTPHQHAGLGALCELVC